MDLDLGYDKENIVVLPMTDVLRPKFKLMKESLIRHSDIIHVSASAHLPFKWENEIQVRPEGTVDREAWTMNGYAVGYDFVEALGIQMIKGRSFNPLFMDEGNCIINETAVKQLKWDDPVGKQLSVGNQEGTVIGVAKDFHFRKLFNNIAPAVLYLDTDMLNTMYVKLSSYSHPQAIDDIKNQWQIFMPDHPFEYAMMDQSFEEAYGDISKSATLGTYVSMVAIMLSCLGLFGLAIHALARRIKEIGIRKVLGATGPGIFGMLLREFLVLVLISNLIGWPIIYFVMQKILQSGYAYRTDIDISVFTMASIITFITAILAIFHQTIKTARTNPGEILRYE